MLLYETEAGTTWKFFTNCYTKRGFRLHIILESISNAKKRLFSSFLYGIEAGTACDLRSIVQHTCAWLISTKDGLSFFKSASLKIVCSKLTIKVCYHLHKQMIS